MPGASGSATITVTVTDNGGTANGGVNAISQSFVVTVTPVNQIPTLNPIANPAPILENTTANPATLQTVNLSGITDGIGDVGQLLTVTAVSSNTGLIPNPTVTYTSPNTNGYLSYTPAAFASGTANITVTVMDNGGTANGGVNQVSRIFTVTVTPINQAPTLNAIPNPAAILEGAGSGTVALTGITAGSGDTGQILTISATSSTAAATAGTVVLSGGGVMTIPIINGGSGYPSAPAVTINGGGGTRRDGERRGDQRRGHRDPDHQSRLGLHLGAIGHDRPAARAADQQLHDQLHQPGHDRYAFLPAGEQLLRHGDGHRHRDGQRRHRQRRHQHLLANLHGDGPARQPRAHARADRHITDHRIAGEYHHADDRFPVGHLRRR